jgi:hypothetical protein
MKDQLVAETSIKKNTPLAGIEPEISAIERVQNYPLNRKATGMGNARVDVYEHTLLSNPENAFWLHYKDRPDSDVKEISRLLAEQYATQSTKHSLARYRVLNLNAGALRYKPAGRGFDSRWCHWNFSVT